MYAYGHEWACQFVYNLHLTVGLGLSDGESTEHLWSYLIKLIGIEHSSSVDGSTLFVYLLTSIGRESAVYG